MDLDEWELLSEDGELNDQIQRSPRRLHNYYSDDVAGVAAGKGSWDQNPSYDQQQQQPHLNTNADMIIHTDYFKLNDPQSNNTEMSGGDDLKDEIKSRDQPDPHQLASDKSQSAMVVKEVVDSYSNSILNHHLYRVVNNNNILYRPRSLALGSEDEEEDDDDMISQVFFKRPRIMEINQFADMKLDSPKSIINRDVDDVTPKENCVVAAAGMSDVVIPTGVSSTKMESAQESMEEEGGLNLWKIGTTGIGAMCSFGFACATTICIVILSGSGAGKKMTQQQQQQKLRFQIYTADKRMKDVVIRRTGKLSSAIRGGGGGGYNYSYNRAEITVGGNYEGRL